MPCRPSTLCLSNCVIQNSHGTECRMWSAGRMLVSPGLDLSIWCFRCAPCDERRCGWTPTLPTPVTAWPNPTDQLNDVTGDGRPNYSVFGRLYPSPSSETQSGSLFNCRQTFRQNATHRSWHRCYWNTQKLSADTQITPRTKVLEKLTVALPVNQFAHLICNPKVYYCLHQSPPLFPILNHTNSVNTPHSYLTSILTLSSHLQLGLTSDIFPSVFRSNISQTLVRATCSVLFSPPSCDRHNRGLHLVISVSGLP
jgi:hypothetical protein